jgi:hypothetical protein
MAQVTCKHGVFSSDMETEDILSIDEKGNNGILQSSETISTEKDTHIECHIFFS